MNFRPELADAVMRCEKTVTRRKVSDNPRSPWWREKCGYRVGQDVAICPGRGKHAIGRARIVSVRRTELGWLSPAEAQMEGFVGCTAVPAARYFEAAWTAINGSYDPEAVVWRIELEAITDG
jgi:hypothetical protein